MPTAYHLHLGTFGRIIASALRLPVSMGGLLRPRLSLLVVYSKAAPAMVAHALVYRSLSGLFEKLLGPVEQ